MLTALILLIIVGLVIVWRLNLRDARAAEAAPAFDPSELRSLEALRDGLSQASGDEVPILAIVLFNGAPELSIERIGESLRKRWSYALEHETPVSNATLQRTLALNKTRVIFEPVADLGRDEGLRSAVDRLSRSGSANFEGAVAQGKTGLVVSAATELGALGRAVVLSQALLAVPETATNATAVYWDASRQLVSRREALKRLKVDYENELPLNLWVAARADQSDGTVSGFTRGLEALNTSEFEALDAPESPKELEARLLGLARYAVLSCRTIFNGDTTGVDEFERIKLVKAPSETVHKGWVFQLRYLKSSKQNPWQR
ncbi:MAG: DUF4261 domain-containing protein [Pseudomonadota bacterium]